MNTCGDSQWRLDYHYRRRRYVNQRVKKGAAGDCTGSELPARPIGRSAMAVTTGGRLFAGGPEARLADDLTIQIGRFDAKLNSSGLGDGWQNRCDFNEAIKALLMDGALVDLTDLVLHDANMNKRSPTNDLTRAASALRARRISRQRPAPWPLTHEGLASIAGGLAAKREIGASTAPVTKATNDLDDDLDAFTSQFAEIDALIERTGKVLRGESLSTRDRASAIYGDARDDEEAEDRWFQELRSFENLPAVQAAAMAWQSWNELKLYGRQPWLGLIVASAVLRAREVTSWSLPLASGFRAANLNSRHPVPRERAIGVFCSLLDQALKIATSDFAALSLSRELMGQRLRGRRASSKLPGLVDLFLSRPVVTMPLAGMHLDVTPHAVKCMFKELGQSLPRELTGRSRYRAWGII